MTTRKRPIIILGFLALMPILLIALFLIGIKSSQRNLRSVEKPTAIVLSGGLADVRGQIHVHSNRSHDSKGTLEEIARAANSAGISWVILTDHPSKKRKASEPNSPVEQDGVLIIFGQENCGKQGRYLTAPLGNADNQLRVYSYFEKWFDLGGGFEWGAVELVNFNTNFRQLPQRLLMGYAGLCYVLPQNIRYWQMISEQQRRPVSIVAATDAHSSFKFCGTQIDPYDVIFKLVSTHILLDAGIELNENLVTEALRKGRSYVAFDYLADPAGFRFAAKKGGKQFLMGDIVAAPDELVIGIPAAQGSEIKIFRDNDLITQQENAQELLVKNPRPGFWRVEIYRDDLPWIISGQILVK